MPWAATDGLPDGAGRRLAVRSGWVDVRRLPRREEGTTTIERLIVVSNRLPLTIREVDGRSRAVPSAGGLVAALGPLMERIDRVWVGWPGIGAATDDDRTRRNLIEAWERDHGFVAVDIPPDVATPFYEGYSNATLWPALHGFPAQVALDHGTWLAYRDANERFANAVTERYRDGDLIWVHDYQLALVPALVRERIPDAAIGFFLHVPFPSSEVFRILPNREQLIRGLLGADLVAFQTHAHMHEFRRALLQVLGLPSRLDRVDVDGRTVSLATLPIGIVVDAWERAIRERNVQRRIAEHRERAGDMRTLVAVDRLDYTKGIPERLRAYRHLLRTRPQWIGKVQLVQVAVPSREAVPRYAELRRQVSELVGEIDGEFATSAWHPVVYLRRSIPRAELAALYATADVAWVSPLRDGMNLVAKEYVACQGDRPGVLVISEFAGAAQEMGEAIRVNPYDMEGSVAAIERALTMPEDERQWRQAALLARIRRNDARAWSTRFVEALRMAVASRSSTSDPALPPAPLHELRAAASAAGQRAFYLDYDGTLVGIAPRPQDAVPTAEALDVLAALAAGPDDHVALLSGRSRADMERWFGDLDGLWLVAEHGALVRDPLTRAWRVLLPGADAGWKERIRPLLEHFADRAPGSFVEEKEFALAWHHRLADPEIGDYLATELLGLLDQQLAGTDLVALRGRKVVEIRFAWANKGDAARAIRQEIGRPGFELALGDDRTDEDLFERLSPRAWTIRVGRGASRARFRVRDPAAALALLRSIAQEPRHVRRESARPSSRSGSRSP